MPPVASKFLPWVTLNWPWRVQSRMVPSLASVMPAIYLERAILGYVLAVAADHDGDFALVVELLGNLWADEILPGADQRIRRAVKHARIFRIIGDIIVRAAVGVIDADAEDLFRRRKRRQQLDFGERHVGPHAGRGGFGLIERLGAEYLAQGLEAVQPRPQIDDAVADHHAETRPAAQRIACKTHIKVSELPAGSMC